MYEYVVEQVPYQYQVCVPKQEQRIASHHVCEMVTEQVPFQYQVCVPRQEKRTVTVTERVHGIVLRIKCDGKEYDFDDFVRAFPAPKK
jgi:hypothetical protein